MKPTEPLRGELAQFDTLLRFADTGLKFTLYLGALLLAAALLRKVFRVSAARRASVLGLGALAVPVIALASMNAGEGRVVLWELPSEPPVEAARAEQGAAAGGSDQNGWVRTLFLLAAEGVRSQLRGEAAAVAVEASPTWAERAASWTPWVIGFWLAGIGVGVLRLGLGVAALGGSARRRTARVDSGPLVEAMRRLSAESGLHREPTLWLADDDTAMPMTWGLRRHHVLLPASAAAWEPARLEMVLRHEIAHVKRGDCVAGWAIRLALAPAWFHPLAWLLGRRAGDFRESACDDTVVGGGEIDGYARELLAISRSHQVVAGALAMAKPKRLEARIRALYCPSVGRGGIGRGFGISVLTLLALVVLPMCLVSACQTVEIAPDQIPTNTQVGNGLGGALFVKDLDGAALEGGGKRVMMKVYEVTLNTADVRDEPDPDPTEKAVRELATAEKGHRVSATLLRSLEQRLGVDTLTLPDFAEGEERTMFIGQKIATPVAPDAGPDGGVEFREVGVKAVTKVEALRRGGISVELDFQIVEVDGAEEAGEGKEALVFATRKAEIGPMTIDDGSGVLLGMVREDVQTVEDKVPLLGDLPALGKLFTNRSSISLKRFVIASFSVDES